MLRNGLWFVALVISACAPWTVLQQAEPNPLAGSKMISVLPLDWTGVAIDALSEPAWNETNDAEMKQEWLVDRQLAITEFQKGVFEASGKLQLVPGAAR